MIYFYNCNVVSSLERQHSCQLLACEKNYRNNIELMVDLNKCFTKIRNILIILEMIV